MEEADRWVSDPLAVVEEIIGERLGCLECSILI